MLANDTLISPSEVRLNALIGSQTDTAQMQLLIIIVEERLFNAYFGSTFYTTLLADRATYTSTLFALNVVYNAGDYVRYNGQTYEVLQTTTGVQTPAQNADYFALPAKFATAANEFIWQRYLKRVLAQSVANEYTIPSAIKQTEKGLIRLKDDAFEPATAGEINTFKENSYQLIKASIDVMEAYIMANAVDYPTYKRVVDSQNACINDKSTASKFRRNTLGIILPEENDYDLYGC